MRKILLKLSVALMFFVFNARAQSKQVTGTVTSFKDNLPIPGVTVLVKGTAIATSTDVDGKFTIALPDDTSRTGSKPKLIFSYLGMETVVQEATDAPMLIGMMDDLNQLKEVIVSGMAIEKDKAKTGYAVQNISGDDLVNSRETNIINALSSKVAGVQITSSSGTPGASSSIKIRGNNSIGQGFSPLFVVDGIPISNDETNSAQERDGNVPFTQGVTNSNRVVDLNSDDIESMTVLKGPAAAALYGIRGANGVIVITTKKGKMGTGNSKADFSFNIGYSFDIVNKLPAFQKKFSQGTGGRYMGPETGQGASWGANIDTLGYDGATDYDYDKKGNIVSTNDPLFNGTKVSPYDNRALFYKTGHTRTLGFSATAGTDKASYYFSVNNSYQDGVIPNTDFGKTSLRLNSEFKLTSKLKFMGSVNYINSGGSRAQQGSNLSGVSLPLFRTPITFDNSNGLSDAATNPDAFLLASGEQRSYRAGGIYDNPFFSVNRNLTKDNVDRIISFGQAKYEFTDWLTVTYRLGIDFFADKRRGGFDIKSAAYPAGRTFEDRISNSDITSDLIISVNKKFGDFDLIINAGHNFFDSNYGRLYAQGDGLTVPNFQSLTNATTYLAYQTNTRRRRYGIYGDATLGYKDRYYLNLTARNDWSSSLPTNHNSFFYPAASVSWIVTEDLKDIGIIPNDDILSFWKIRASIAKVGRDAPAYSTYTIYGQPLVNDGYTNGIPFPYAGTNGLGVGTTGGSSQPSLGNPLLRPENNTTYEVGTELAFFKKRVTYDFTYYYADNRDQIVQAQVPSSTGFQYYYTNAGRIRNEGIEMVASVMPIKTKSFSWTIGMNYTRNRSKVISLAPGIDNLFLNGFQGSGSYAIPGQPYGVFYGTALLRDGNGNMVIGADGYPILDAKPRILGNPNPDFLMGIRNGFQLAGFSLNVLLDIRKGGSVWNGTRGAMEYFGTAKSTEIRGQKAIFDGVLADADGNPTTVRNTQEVVLDQAYFRGIGSSFQGPNDGSMEVVNWLRCREVTLGYSFPKTMVSKLKLGSLNLSLFARNLFLVTNYTGVDPETNLTSASNGFGLDYFNNPNTKSYGANLKVTF